MVPSLWERFRQWQRDRAIVHYEDEPARRAAEEERYAARTQALRPQGSGRETRYDRGDTGQY